MSNEQFIPQEYSISAAQQQSRLPRAQDRYDSDLFYDASGQPSRYTSVADTPSISQSPTPAYPSRHTALTENSMSEQEELEQHQRAAILQWGRRAKACFAIQLISALCLLHSIYWYSTVIGLVILIGLLVFAYSIKQQQTNFVRVYVLIVLVNLAKNVVILYFFMEENKTSQLSTYEYFLVVLLIVDCVIFTPSSLYSCFYLHRSISLTSLTF